ncbi:hypothetical protein HK096_002804 [Nowakowskiella sp. JEL0078]|nr:hypothetical protein HK096_002804 [Nowakowskiella sp. JEL0078]
MLLLLRLTETLHFLWKLDLHTLSKLHFFNCLLLLHSLLGWEPESHRNIQMRFSLESDLFHMQFWQRQLK